MTLDQFVKIQSIIDKRAIRSDTLAFLNKKRFSKSKQEWIRFGDMHFDHFISVVASGEMSGSDDLLAFVIDGFMKTLIKTGKAQKLTKDEFIEEITKNGKKHNYN
tara:strand:+ start:152 stop:466 length:315 start_codon:yes stop_codon:yes gene_type:complete